MSPITVHRLDYGYFVRPAAETGTGSPRVEPCLGYLVRHPDGLLLFDTGMGSDPEVDQWYRPRRTPVADALAALGIGLADIDVVANCHLHFDHCGGNALFAGKPVYVQSVELTTARTRPDYTLAELIDVPGSDYRELAGDGELLPGVFAWPTPGHTEGHQSLVVRTAAGSVVVAGQSHDNATSFSADLLALRARRDGHGPPLPDVADWVERIERLEPAEVVFAHDHSIWQPSNR
jgi:N-acyl homoserine lactone hydrolase